MQSDGTSSGGNEPQGSTHYALRDWLANTLSEHKKGLTDHEWKVLQEVMASSPTEPTALTECAERLVDAFLRLRFANSRQDESSRQRMAARIATTLCSDPTARTRLAEFQSILRQAAQ